MTSAGDVAPIVIGSILIALAAAFFVEACGERRSPRARAAVRVKACIPFIYSGTTATWQSNYGASARSNQTIPDNQSNPRRSCGQAAPRWSH